MKRLPVGETDTYTFTGKNLVGWVQWGKPGKIDPKANLSVKLTSPNGTELIYDDPDSNKQVFYGTDEDGEHLIVVTNTGTKAVRYEIEYGA